MFKKLLAWIKKNKLASILILVLLFLLAKNYLNSRPSLRSYPETFQQELPVAGGGDYTPLGSTGSKSKGGIGYYDQGAAPAPEAKNRLVVEESNISLVVGNVRQEIDKILDYVSSKGGYLVFSTVNQPEEVPSATLTVRLPNKELRPALEFLRGLAIKVTYEYLSGYDVTDEYLDVESRMATLEKTKAKFEEIMTKAQKVEEIMSVQREIINLQDQIDSLKGRQDYLKKTAENARLTVYLSSDQWSLPYAPQDNVFRPKVVFKMAVRSLVNNLRSLGKAGIWIGVYSVIWLPALLIWKIIKRRRNVAMV